MKFDLEDYDVENFFIFEGDLKNKDFSYVMYNGNCF